EPIELLHAGNRRKVDRLVPADIVAAYTVHRSIEGRPETAGYFPIDDHDSTQQEQEDEGIGQSYFDDKMRDFGGGNISGDQIGPVFIREPAGQEVEGLGRAPGEAKHRIPGPVAYRRRRHGLRRDKVFATDL